MPLFHNSFFPVQWKLYTTLCWAMRQKRIKIVAQPHRREWSHQPDQLPRIVLGQRLFYSVEPLHLDLVITVSLLILTHSHFCFWFWSLFKLSKDLKVYTATQGLLNLGSLSKWVHHFVGIWMCNGSGLGWGDLSTYWHTVGIFFLNW